MKSRDRRPAILRDTAGIESDKVGPFELPPLPPLVVVGPVPPATRLPPAAPRRSWPPLAIFAVTVGAIAAALVILLTGTAVLVLLVDVAQSEPLRRIRLEVTAPPSVAQGDAADVNVVVTNRRGATVEARRLTVSDELLKQFDVVEVTLGNAPLSPLGANDLDVSAAMDPSRSRRYRIEKDLQPGQAAAVRVRLKARRGGVCAGSVALLIAEGRVQRPVVITVRPAPRPATGATPPGPTRAPAPPQTRAEASPSSPPRPGSGTAGR